MHKVVVALIAYLAVITLLMGWSALDTRSQGEDTDERWDKARIEVMDYLNTDRLPTELTTNVGWSAAQVKQLQIWNTTDAVFSTEAFTQVAKIAPASAKPTLRDLLVPLYRKSLWALLAIATVGFLWRQCFAGRGWAKNKKVIACGYRCCWQGCCARR